MLTTLSPMNNAHPPIRERNEPIRLFADVHRDGPDAAGEGLANPAPHNHRKSDGVVSGIAL
jgi:hypothetical protein